MNFLLKTNDGRDRKSNFAVTALRLNPWGERGASHRPAFMGNWPKIIHIFLVLSTQWMSSPSMK